MNNIQILFNQAVSLLKTNNIQHEVVLTDEYEPTTYIQMHNHCSLELSRQLKTIHKNSYSEATDEHYIRFLLPESTNVELH